MKPASPPIPTLLIALLAVSHVDIPTLGAQDLIPVSYRRADLEVDLGVGLWAIPLPMDYDGDGDLDLLVSTTNKTTPGIYFFENPGGGAKMPVFEPAVRIGDAKSNVTISYSQGDSRVMTPGRSYPNFRQTGLAGDSQSVRFDPPFHTGRTNQWKLFDYDGDGREDLIIGASDWRDYGWDDAFDSQGKFNFKRV